jgi:hypothetical protein
VTGAEADFVPATQIKSKVRHAEIGATPQTYLKWILASSKGAQTNKARRVDGKRLKGVIGLRYRDGGPPQKRQRVDPGLAAMAAGGPPV